MKISHGKHIFYIDKISKKISAGLSGLQCTRKVCNHIPYKTRETMCVPNSYCALF